MEENQNNFNQNMNQDNQRPQKRPEGNNRFWTGVLAGSLVTVFAGLIVVGMSLGIYLFSRSVVRGGSGPQVSQNGPGITDGKEQEELNYEQINTKMSLLQEIIDQHFLYDEDLKQVEDYIYKGMMAGLDDPYSGYYTAEECRELIDSTEGVYSGIGAMLSQNQNTGLCTIVRVFENSPAQEAGMRPGDILYKVDDKIVAAESLSVVVSNYIKGQEGSQVNMTVYRQEEDEYVDMTLTRRRIEVPTVEHQMLEGQIGYILIIEFDAITVQQFMAAVDDLEAQGMKGLVLDLRNNPGGKLDSAVGIADYLLPDNFTRYDQNTGKTMIVYTADKNEKGDHHTASDGHQMDLPIAVLMNENSASASEVLAGALRDYNWATIVGTTSYGKGIVQTVVPLHDGSAIKITIANYYTPSGFNLHGKGLEPDVEVELDKALRTQSVVKIEEDNQVRRAVEVVNESIRQSGQN